MKGISSGGLGMEDSKTSIEVDEPGSRHRGWRCQQGSRSCNRRSILRLQSLELQLELHTVVSPLGLQQQLSARFPALEILSLISPLQHTPNIR